ncbi:MAG: polyprenyl synthetase family protein [Clostridia bacterium]|nr:polyprenyl synthetase family protein [Clostridia bacterium]MBR7062820.1 polyprenyl synthetase family protein [Clostridia bacterium]
MGEFLDKLQGYADYIDAELEKLLPPRDNYQKVIYDAMRYSLLGGGKRIRPVLLLVSAELFGLSKETVLPLALAVEMVHTYSLIHDDLPAMDNDDYRRGRLSCHRRFDEATAILAGDALLTYAFEVAGEGVAELTAKAAARWDNEAVASYQKILPLLARRGGTEGMVGGQIIDLKAENNTIDEYEHDALCRMKTGCLIAVSSEIAVLCAQKSGTEEGRLLTEYARAIGLAFQIKDDILDVEGDPAMLGKNTGMDEADNKTTFVTLYGIDGAKQMLSELTMRAVDNCLALKEIPGCSAESADFLKELARFLLERKY